MGLPLNDKKNKFILDCRELFCRVIRLKYISKTTVEKNGGNNEKNKHI